MGKMDDFLSVDLDGFQVVSADSFCQYQRYDEPTITLWINQIAFSKAAVHALNDCERVRMEVNTQTRKILLIPVTAKDKDGIRWSIDGKESKGRKIECRAFSEKIYPTWGWQTDYVYKAHGRIVVADQKVMLLFDFSSPQCWKYGAKAKAEDQ